MPRRNAWFVVERCKNPLVVLEPWEAFPTQAQPPSSMATGPLGWSGSPSSRVALHGAESLLPEELGLPLCPWKAAGQFALGFAALFLLISSLQQVGESMKTGY